MRVAFSIWENRIAPVFDTFDQIRLIDVGSDQRGEWSQVVLPHDLPIQKALRLVELKVDTLICGAISRAMHRMIDTYGIQIVSFVTGDIDDILKALVSGRTDWSCFAMPGCALHGRRRRSRGNFGRNRYSHRDFTGGDD